MRRINPTLREKFEHELELAKNSNIQTMRNRLEKRKIGMTNLCNRKDFHFILNSLLQGDIYSQDILNQFWDHNFKQTATINDIIHCYNNSTITLLQKIIQNNIYLHELTGQRQKYKQQHNFKMLNRATQEYQSISRDNIQYLQDLGQLCKPFGINLGQIVVKFKPHRSKEKLTLREDTKFNNQGNMEFYFDQEEEEQKTQTAPMVEAEQLTQEEKWYRLAVYLSVFVFIVDLSLSYSKINLLDLTIDLLLLLNSLFECFLLKDEYFDETYAFITVNYQENRLGANDTLIHAPSNVKTISLTSAQLHSFEKYTYSSFCFLLFGVFFDILWLLIIRPSFMVQPTGKGILLMSGLLWKYNQYVVYASLIVLVAKILILLILTQTVEFQFKKLISRYNFYLNFLRFSSSNYMNLVIVESNKQ